MEAVVGGGAAGAVDAPGGGGAAKEEKWLDEKRQQLSGTIHANLIPPSVLGDIRLGRRWGWRMVLFIHLIQLLLTWLLFGMSISHYSLLRTKSTACTAVLTDQTGENSIAATCTGAVLVDESRIELSDPFYEASLNLTEQVESGAVSLSKLGFLAEFYSSFIDHWILFIVMELFLIVFLYKKIKTSMALVVCGLKDPDQRGWGLVRCGTMLNCLVLNQIVANLLICINSRNSGESLYNTIFATFTLLLVADLDNKHVFDGTRLREVVHVAFPRGNRTPVKFLKCISSSFLFPMFVAAIGALLPAAIYIAINDLRFSELFYSQLQH